MYFIFFTISCCSLHHPSLGSLGSLGPPTCCTKRPKLKELPGALVAALVVPLALRQAAALNSGIFLCESGGGQWILMGFLKNLGVKLWIFMDIYGHLWISMDIYGYLWIIDHLLSNKDSLHRFRATVDKKNHWDRKSLIRQP